MDEDRGILPRSIFAICYKPLQIIDIDGLLHILSPAYVLTGGRADPADGQGHGVVLLNDP